MIIVFYNSYAPAVTCTRWNTSRTYIHYDRAVRNIAVGTANSFTIATSTYDGARRRNYIAFRDVDKENQSIRSYGRVLAFISHEHDGKNSSLALIKPLNTIVDPPTEQSFFYKECRNEMLIDIGEIVGPIGVIKVQTTEGLRNRAVERHWIAEGYRCLIPT